MPSNRARPPKRVAIGLTCLTFILTAFPSSAAAQAVREVRDTVIQNGLHVIVVPNHTIPLATLEVVVHAGAFTQSEPEDEGLPHILEHMLFKSYRGGEGFSGRASDLGATYNGTTSDERHTYFLTLPSDKVDDGLEALGGLMRNPDFSRRDLDAERQVVRGELERMVSDPYAVLDLVSEMALWGPTFQRKNAIGNMSTILSADPGRVRDHFKKFYIPNNAALIVSGDVDPDEVFEWAQNRFRRWDDGPDPFADFVPPTIVPLERDTSFVVEVPSTDVTFSIKWQGPSVSDDPVGTLAADVFSEMFNQATSGAQGRLVDTGIFQAASMGYTPLDYVGPVQLRARTTPEQVVKALTEIGVEMALFSDPTYFDEQDLEAAKRALRVDAAIDRQVVTSAAHDLADYWAIGGLDYYRGYESGLQAVTLEDVRTYVHRYLVGKPRVIAVLATQELMGPLSQALQPFVDAWPKVGL